MDRVEARTISRSLRDECMNRIGKCWGKEKCKQYDNCSKYLGDSQKPTNFDLVDLIDFIEEKF